jgi:hypothetical protein
MTFPQPMRSASIGGMPGRGGSPGRLPSGPQAPLHAESSNPREGRLRPISRRNASPAVRAAAVSAPIGLETVNAVTGSRVPAGKTLPVHPSEQVPMPPGVSGCPPMKMPRTSARGRELPQACTRGGSWSSRSRSTHAWAITSGADTTTVPQNRLSWSTSDLARIAASWLSSNSGVIRTWMTASRSRARTWVGLSPVSWLARSSGRLSAASPVMSSPRAGSHAGQPPRPRCQRRW